jgi:hypothetical protein
METIAAAHRVSEKKNIFNILHQDLGLEKKFARWVPKLLSDDQYRRGYGSVPSSSLLSTANLRPCWT